MMNIFDEIIEWSENSIKGKVCSIFNCPKEPKNMCPKCYHHYCLNHVKLHSHAKDSQELVVD